MQFGSSYRRVSWLGSAVERWLEVEGKSSVHHRRKCVFINIGPAYVVDYINLRGKLLQFVGSRCPVPVCMAPYNADTQFERYTQPSCYAQLSSCKQLSCYIWLVFSSFSVSPYEHLHGTTSGSVAKLIKSWHLPPN